MTDDESAAERLFFEVFEALPRQGPGSLPCTERALALCGRLPESPRVLDLGCGTGAQTLDLARLTAGPIVAIDAHRPSVERLRSTVRASGLTERIEASVGDIGDPPDSLTGFDLIWSEGALYNIGIARALELYLPRLNPGGVLAFTEAVWLKPDPPEQVTALFAEYPAMGTIEDVIRVIAQDGASLMGHFTLPDEAWWDDFYRPMQARIAELRELYAGDGAALAVLDQLAEEPETHARFGSYYGYEFFVVMR